MGFTYTLDVSLTTKSALYLFIHGAFRVEDEGKVTILLPLDLSLSLTLSLYFLSLFLCFQYEAVARYSLYVR